MDSQTKNSQSASATAVSNLESWVAKQKADGLVDMKFALGPVASSTTATIEEFLQAEEMFAAGIEKPHLTEAE